MKTKPLTYLLALTFLISGSTIVSAKQKFGDYEGAIYVRNYDGDTITFNLPNLHPIIGKNIRVRLNGIDTPEIKGICDKEKYDAEQALHGASLPREFERQDMAKIFNKKSKTRFPILFKRALDFHLMKAQSRLR